MKNEFLEGFLDNLMQESGSKKKLVESDLEDYLDDDDEDEEFIHNMSNDEVDDMDDDTHSSARDILKSKKEYGKVYTSSNSYQLGRTGKDVRYRVDYDKLLLVLNDTLKKKLTRADVKKIVKIVKLELGVGSESEKSDF